MKMKEIEKGEGKKENVKENKWKRKTNENVVAAACFLETRYS